MVTVSHPSLHQLQVWGEFSCHDFSQHYSHVIGLSHGISIQLDASGSSYCEVGVIQGVVGA